MNQIDLYTKLLKIKKTKDKTDYPFNMINRNNIVFTKKQVRLYEDTECKNVKGGGAVVFL